MESFLLIIIAPVITLVISLYLISRYEDRRARRELNKMYHFDDDVLGPKTKK